APSRQSGTTRPPSAGGANSDPRRDTPRRSWHRLRIPPEKHGWRLHRGLQQRPSRTHRGPFRLPSVFRGRRATDPTRSREVLRSFRIVKVWFLVVHVLSVSSSREESERPLSRSGSLLQPSPRACAPWWST